MFLRPVSFLPNRRFRWGTAVFLALAACSGVSLSACESATARGDRAVSIAAPAGLTRQTVTALPFSLTVYSRITQPGGPASVYIEGDGLAYLDRSTPSADPTPRHPVGLELAAADTGPNVIYLARPCQYSGMADGGVCPDKYWTSARLAPEVIAALNAALDTLKAQGRLSGFDLTGFSGGGGAAVLLAARRQDVSAIRTVSGDIDQAAFTSLHHLTPLSASLDPHDVAVKVASIPQIHFVGKDDSIVPSAIAESFRAAAGNPACLRIETIDGAGHDERWAGLWPRLRAEPLPCGH